MSTRLIENCFEAENLEEEYSSIRFILVDPCMLSAKDIVELQNPMPGKIIPIRKPSMKVMHAIRY